MPFGSCSLNVILLHLWLACLCPPRLPLLARPAASGGVSFPLRGRSLTRPTDRLTRPRLPPTPRLLRSQRWRETAAEKRELDRLQQDMINEVRQAAEVHRQVRAYVHTIAKPGILMTDLCQKLEDSGGWVGGWVGAVEALVEVGKSPALA